MNLLKYINPIKNIPDRFSNLAFWRCVRKLKDCIISALDYINVWGTGIEDSLSEINTNLSGLQTWKTSVDSSLSSINTDLSGLQTWKTSVDSSLSRIDADLSGLKEWKTSVDSSLSTLQEWKTGVDSTLSSINTDLSGLKEWKTSVDSSLSTINTDLSGLKEWKTSVDSSLSSINTDLSGLKEWKTSVDSSLSTLQEWKTSVDSSLSEVINVVKSVSNIASSAQTSATKALARINGAFEILEYDIVVSQPSSYQKINNAIPDAALPYPRVDYYMLTFPVNDSRITNSDIIESATFRGFLNIDYRPVQFNSPFPLFPVISGSKIYLIAYPIPIYSQNSSLSITQGQITLHIRCRRIPSE